MKTRVKATKTVLTPPIERRIDRICTRLEKLTPKKHRSELSCAIEVGTITKHHKKGDVSRAEINFFAMGTLFRAKARGESVGKALDLAHHEIKRQYAHFRHKQESVARRTGVYALR
ncbi:hypothetical protein A3H77_02530 [Candidatus Kaiserbacteria bacterium RIFCSPLOWO2_02_FULL_56_11]|uniref:Ribosomal subunit interface protein n=2 Tax=Candidatus Kaiseribacteriota TaxID=1752734 RepID=A0A1F6E426_9BACT|nr:MAG: hypothetical protein A3C95_01740 [Candidatus Kaiserbacteria bacterium RIFCSPHIGHO2_02_FULL_56_30]OGG72122.1 MAG: hypothetical protein A3E65_00830 [Candidatus Kaiserbacteria bacterium RIFCSPHIGHO2_12_FULL_56_13]OGG82083.1 MAG: hypothetical protein A3H77_02530 [Candidatus Kaiserbacteria bacterium RIFCSPLOWO2_02_FULL_56_11]